MKLFKKLPVALSVATVLTLSISSTALAGNGNGNGNGNGGGSQGDNNGQPFQELSAIISQNRALIEANQGDIAGLKSVVSNLKTALTGVYQQIDSIDATVKQNTASIGTALTQMSANAQDIAALRNQLVSVHEDVLASITQINNTVATLEQDIEGVLSQLNVATEALQAKLSELETAVALNAVGIDGLQMQVVSLVSQLSSLNANANTLTWKHEQMSERVDELQNQVDALALVVANIGDSDDDTGDTGNNDGSSNACFSFTNTGSVDLLGADWFDNCVDAQGDNIKLVLKDESGNVTYQASGSKAGAWTYDYITATSLDIQHMVPFHDQIISLDNGHYLVISGKGHQSGGCSFDMYTGYTISVYSSAWGMDPILTVMPYYRNGNASDGVRGMLPWTSDREITWNSGDIMNACAPFGYGTPTVGFKGSFEFFVSE